jgi:hypothetical protein
MPTGPLHTSMELLDGKRPSYFRMRFLLATRALYVQGTTGTTGSSGYR